MELTYDWSNFRATFQSSAPAILPGSAPAPIKLVVAHGKIVALATSGAPKSSQSRWIGKSVDAFKEAHPDQRVYLFERESVESWVSDALSAEPTHLHEQMMQIFPKTELAPQPHFLLKAFESNWAKVFPSSFGILIRLSDVSDLQARDFFIILKQGKLALFHRPELSTMGALRAEDLTEVVKYLSEKHSVPVQALRVSEAQWHELGRAAQPWKDLAALIKANHAGLVPFRWPVLAWIAIQSKR
jgi:hypothetical protein